MDENNTLQSLTLCPSCQTSNLINRVSLWSMLYAAIAMFCLLSSQVEDTPVGALLALAAVFGTAAVGTWRSGKLRCPMCRRVFAEADSYDSESTQCPRCGSQNNKRRFLAGSPGWATVILILAFFLFTEPFASLFLSMIALMAFTSPQYKCKECKRTFSPAYPLALAVRCPECDTVLHGATYSMIGDTAACSKCNVEFEIKV